MNWAFRCRCRGMPDLSTETPASPAQERLYLLHRLRRRSLDLRRRLELLKVLRKTRGQIGSCLVVGRLIFPRVPGRQNLRRNSGAGLRNAESEGRLDFI